MKITTCLLVLINQSRTESYEFVSSLSAHDSSQREMQKTGISYMITMGSEAPPCLANIEIGKADEVEQLPLTINNYH